MWRPLLEEAGFGIDAIPKTQDAYYAHAHMRGTPRDATRSPQDFRESAAARERLAEHIKDPKARATLLYEAARCRVPQLDARLALAKQLKIEEGERL